jgi:hypothetical protein
MPLLRGRLAHVQRLGKKSLPPIPYEQRELCVGPSGKSLVHTFLALQFIRSHEDPYAMYTIDTGFLHWYCRTYIHILRSDAILIFLYSHFIIMFFIFYIFYIYILAYTSLRQHFHILIYILYM